MGTTGKIRSGSRGPNPEINTPMVCKNVDRCEYTTPLGLPVVPLV
jgi:hypothetical protein